MTPVRRLQDEAYDFIKEKIANGEFVEGPLYSETKTTAMLGMSRTPVRDALLRLNMEGLIDIYPSRGFAIRNVTKTEIKETLEIRWALEGYAAYVLAEQQNTPAARETMFKLNECVDEQERLLRMEKLDVTKFVEQNFTFHNTMIEFLGNNAMAQMYKKYENKIKEMTYRHFTADSDRVQHTFNAHVQLVAMIRTGNKEQAFTRAKAHTDVSFFM